ncbi:hypothetical protein GOP47_0009777 [Adiantum capillus-veneris]|uniref:DUF4371 domain-containing protein n=1 Tax=Adiantum capillus-veneris TaxID=13818 RepID=A0A9D4ZJT4_ADICA|nr:hypothetical protein GOP47_0009777 [Adiantum capillus-veneris]
MQTLWFVVRRNFPFDEFSKLCNFQCFMRTPNMPIASEYSAYTSTISARKEFANAIKQAYWERLKEEIVASPFYSLQIDEITDVSTQQNMILYVTYMREHGNGCICTSFVDLLHVKNAEAESLYSTLIAFLDKMKLPFHKMIGIATDGASVMIGANNGVVSRLKKVVPHLLSFHCVAHRESLAAGDAFKLYKEFKFVDKVARKLYEWASRSAKRRLSLAEVVKDFNLGRNGKLKLLKMHDVRWLSKGQVMIRIVRLMPALLNVLKAEEADLYAYLTNYKIEFLLHFFADVLGELNVLSCKLQEDHIDIFAIGNHLKASIESLQMAFLGNVFGCEAMYTQLFLTKVINQHGIIDYIDSSGNSHSHQLHLGPMCDEDVLDPHETLHGVVNNLAYMVRRSGAGHKKSNL